ncbi:MAG TPA: hypothetical protein VKA70_20070 [Blastocatellia bacterium]|nr:hypothetical protein [Blastocatellia bacterium]
MSLRRSVVTGAIGFSIVSLCVFATVALAQRWMYDRLGVTGAYIAWLTLFILLGGRALLPVVAGARRLSFYATFGVAFLAYGISWIAAYFSSTDMAGQWLGSLAGSIAMALVFSAAFSAIRSAPLFSLLLFATNSVGYFLGSVFYYTLGRPAGLLLWGAFYGLCLGAGLGAVLHVAQSRQKSRISDEQG